MAINIVSFLISKKNLKVMKHYLTFYINRLKKKWILGEKNYKVI